MTLMSLHGGWRVSYNWHIHFCLILWNTEGGAIVAFCLTLLSTKDSVVVGGDCNTQVLTPWYLIVHNLNIVLRSWHGSQGQCLSIDEFFVDR